jgi:transcriptional regulator with XRE-family HTH domain
MLTKFGQFIRKLRIDMAMNLGEMAERLTLSPSYLSAVETGKKQVTNELLSRIVSEFSLVQAQINEMYFAASESKKEEKINLVGLHDKTRQTVAMFARSIENGSLSAEQIKALREILDTTG